MLTLLNVSLGHSSKRNGLRSDNESIWQLVGKCCGFVGSSCIRLACEGHVTAFAYDGSPEIEFFTKGLHYPLQAASSNASSAPGKTMRVWSLLVLLVSRVAWHENTTSVNIPCAHEPWKREAEENMSQFSAVCYQESEFGRANGSWSHL
eukprot:1029680-Amphidinium_carterae.2